MNDRKPLKYRGIMWLMALLGFAVMAISIWGCAADRGLNQERRLLPARRERMTASLW